MTPEVWAAFLRAGAKAADDDVKAVLKKGAVNVKKAWIASAKGTAGKSASAYPYAITFDEPEGSAGFGAGSFRVEIGPDKGRTQGPLGNLLEYGSVNNGPSHDGARALEDEAPRTAEYLAKVVMRRW